jgi:hypothetical protein
MTKQSIASNVCGSSSLLAKKKSFSSLLNLHYLVQVYIKPNRCGKIWPTCHFTPAVGDALSSKLCFFNFMM